MGSEDRVKDTLPSRHERCWYAVFTQCHHERRVAHQLEVFNIEYFLPTYQHVSQWKDRVVRLEQALFPAYVFVRIERGEMKQVLQTRGTVKLVGPAGKPVPIPAEEISFLQLAVQSYPTEPTDYFSLGERVRIEAGPLRGISGVLVRKLGKTRVAIAVNTIFRAFTVEVDPSLLSKASAAVPGTTRVALGESA